MSDVPVTTDLTFALDWRHGLGARGAFFAAVAAGRLIGARCPACGATVVPPRARCGNDATLMVPVDLPPAGKIRQLTLGAPSALARGDAGCVFALVQVEGADNSLLTRITGAAAVGARVTLAPATGEVIHPAQHLVFAVTPAH